MNGLYRWTTMSIKEKQDYRLEMELGNYLYIDPETNDKDSLETQYIEFLNQPHDRRKRIDEITTKYLGCTNGQLHSQIHSELLSYNNSDDFVTPDSFLSEAAGISDEKEMHRVADSILDNFSLAKSLNDEAIAWSQETGMALIIMYVSDRETLDEELANYNSMIRRHRIFADAKSVSLYGLTVQQMHDFLISKLSNDVELITPDDILSEGAFYKPHDVFFKEYYKRYINEISGTEFIAGVSKELEKCTTTYMETIVQGFTLDDLLSRYDDANNPDIAINYGDMPFYSPQEMIDMGVYSYGTGETRELNTPEDDMIITGSELVEWVHEWNLILNGFPINEKFDTLNRKRVKAIQYYLATNSYNESTAKHLLELGWNPKVPFSSSERNKIDKYWQRHIKNKFGESTIIDLCGLGAGHIGPEVIKEYTSSSGVAISKTTENIKEVEELEPIFLVFEGADSPFATAIKAVTNGPYSHASISFDPTLRRIYSYAVNGSSNGIRGGFAIEDVKSKDPDYRLGVYAIFVNRDIYKKIKDNVEYFHKNMKATSYAYANILSIIFNIPFERSKNLICSQFVDRMLKIGGIDITGKSSSLVDPNFLARCSSANKAIYRIFDGKVKSFHPSIIAQRLTKISRNPQSMEPEIIGYWNIPMPKFEMTIDSIQESYSNASPIMRTLYRHVYKVDPISGVMYRRETKFPELNTNFSI